MYAKIINTQAVPLEWGSITDADGGSYQGLHTSVVAVGAL